jgi:hypothetical protein
LGILLDEWNFIAALQLFQKLEDGSWRRFAPAWDSSTSLRSVFNSRFAAFKRCYAALKDLTSFDLQSQDMHVLMGDFFFVHCKSVPLEFLIAEGV